MKEELRAQIEKIVSLTNEEFRSVSAYFSEIHFKKNQVIVQEGAYVQYDYFVCKGLMKSFHVSPDGKDHIIQFALENGWITDPQAFHNQTAATLTIDCLEDTTVLGIAFSDKEKLCRELHKMEYFFSKKATAGYIDLQKRILCLISSTASKRYNNMLSQYPGLMQRVSKSMIASYLGVSRETLSRLGTVSV